MDLLFGAVDNYTVDQMIPWMRSAREAGYKGEIVLLVYRGDLDTIIPAVREYDVSLIHSDMDGRGNSIDHNARGRDTQSHQMRFFHLWQYLCAREIDELRYVMTTDVRDVIFQRNPVEWLEENVRLMNQFVAPSEGIQYRHETWGQVNMLQGFGPYVSHVADDYTICNVGTIAGMAPAMRDLSLLLYTMGENRYIPNDQSAFNLLVNSSLFSVVRAEMKSAWAAQLGTTLDPEKTERFKPHWVEPPPIVEDGKVYTNAGELFYLVHQWDRVPGLKQEIENRYL